MRAPRTDESLINVLHSHAALPTKPKQEKLEKREPKKLFLSFLPFLFISWYECSAAVKRR
jgi:hypothetical protein